MTSMKCTERCSSNLTVRDYCIWFHSLSCSVKPTSIEAGPLCKPDRAEVAMTGRDDRSCVRSQRVCSERRQASIKTACNDTQDQRQGPDDKRDFA